MPEVYIIMDKPLINIGKVVSAHGLKGELKVYPYTDFPERCHNLNNVIITESGQNRVIEVEHARVHGKLWIIKLKGMSNFEEAIELKGLNLYILPWEREALPPDHYYYDEIIGLEVYSGEGEFLGIIKDILPGGQDIYVVSKKENEGDILIPAAKKIIRDIDIGGGRLTADLPDGLMDL